MLDLWNYADPYLYMKKTIKNEMQPLIITVAITGLSGKEENPHVPETPEEQAQEARRVFDAGAVSVHIHARDTTGASSVADPVRFREINAKVREACPEIIIGNTTGVGPGVPREEVPKALDAEPELCSLNMGPVCFAFNFKERKAPLKGRDKGGYMEFVQPFGFTDQERMARRALEKNIKPEMELYNDSMFYAFLNLIAKDLIKKPYWMQLIFGTTFMPPTAAGLAQAVSMLPAGSLFSTIGVGPFQLPIAVMSIVAGGHVRVGLEDNLFYKRGEPATNAQLVERIVRIARELGREIATPTQARQMLDISATPSKY